MTTKEFYNLILEKKDKYLEKSKNFNKKKTILICKKEELELFNNLSNKENIKFDQVYFSCNLEKIFTKYKNDINYFISNNIINDTVYMKILESKINLENVYIGPTKDAYFDLYDKRYIIYSNIDKIFKVYNLLEDEKSKNIYLNIIVRLCIPYQYHYYYEIEDNKQYYFNNFKFAENEVYLDAGVCDGKNVLDFFKFVKGKYEHIYGFEADKSNYELSKKNLEKYNLYNFELIQGALYSKKGYLSFFSSKKTGKKGNAHVQENGDIIVKAYIGDDLIKLPTFIKMDIEGSEKDALLGLKNIIEKKSPKLAICIYHFQEDFWEIPILINNLNPNYKLAIRNHEKMYNLLETVCYAYIEEDNGNKNL